MKLTQSQLEELYKTYEGYNLIGIIKNYLDAVTPDTNTPLENDKIYQMFLTNDLVIRDIIFIACKETVKNGSNVFETFKEEFNTYFGFVDIVDEILKKEKEHSVADETTHLSTPYEQVNHPSHYNKYDVEVVDMMEKIWGKYETAIWCKLTAFKYRMRLGEKPDNPIQQDLNKETWYLDKYNSLKKELEEDNESK